MSPTNVRVRSEAPQSDMLCPLCGASGLMQRHCKIVCERCGYVESCEDNFLPTRVAPRAEPLDTSLAT